MVEVEGASETDTDLYPEIRYKKELLRWCLDNER